MNTTEEDNMSQPVSPTTNLVHDVVNEALTPIDPLNEANHSTNKTFFVINQDQSEEEKEAPENIPSSSQNLGPTIDLNHFLSTIDLKKLEVLSPHTKVFLNKESTFESGLLFIDGLLDPTLFSNRKFLDRMYHVPSGLDFVERIVEKKMRQSSVIVGQNLAMMSLKRTFSPLEYILSPEMTISCDELTFDWNGFACQLLTIMPFSDDSPIEKIRIFSDANQFYLKGSLDLSKSLEEVVLNDFILVGGHMMVFLKKEKMSHANSSDQSLN